MGGASSTARRAAEMPEQQMPPPSAPSHGWMHSLQQRHRESRLLNCVRGTERGMSALQPCDEYTGKLYVGVLSSTCVVVMYEQCVGSRQSCFCECW